MNGDEKTSVVKRQRWLDVARLLAFASVLMNHALSRSFATQKDTLGEFLLLPKYASAIKATLYAFSRIGVPLFLMISGALLIERQYEKPRVLRRFIRHNWWELFRTTEIWLVIMFWFLQIFQTSVLRTEGIGKACISFIETLLFINQKTMASMWYMSMILCVYLLIPFFSVALRDLGDRLLYVLCGIVVFSGMIVPNINTALAATGSAFSLNLSFGQYMVFPIYAAYLLCGYWISKGKLARLNTAIVLLCLVFCFSATSAFQYWLYSTSSDYYLRYADIGILASSVFLFELLRRSERRPQGKGVLLRGLADMTFGLYFVHICVMTGIDSILDKALPHLGHFPKLFVLSVSTLMLSVIIVWATSKIPLFRKYLYLMKDEAR